MHSQFLWTVHIFHFISPSFIEIKPLVRFTLTQNRVYKEGMWTEIISYLHGDFISFLHWWTTTKMNEKKIAKMKRILRVCTLHNWFKSLCNVHLELHVSMLKNLSFLRIRNASELKVKRYANNVQIGYGLNYKIKWTRNRCLHEIA